MTTDKEKPSLKEQREKEKQRKQDLRVKRASNSVNRALNDIHQSQLKTDQTSAAFLKESIGELSAVMADAEKMLTDVITQVEAGLADKATESNEEFRGLLAIFRRDVESIDKERVNLLSKIERIRANGSFGDITSLYSHVVDFAVKIGDILIPQSQRINDLAKASK